MSDQLLSSRRIWLSLLPMLLYALVAPYVIFRLASPHMSTVAALLLAAIPPAVVTVVDLVRRRRLNLIGSLALLGILIKLTSALFFKDARLVLISDSLLMGVYGLLMLGSLLVGKPLLLTLAKSALAGMDAGERAQMEQRWLARGRAKFVFHTALWGAGLLGVLVVNTLLVYTLTVSQFLLVGPAIQYSMLAVLIGVPQVIALIRRASKRPLEQAEGQAQKAPEVLY